MNLIFNFFVKIFPSPSVSLRDSRLFQAFVCRNCENLITFSQSYERWTLRVNYYYYYYYQFIIIVFFFFVNVWQNSNVHLNNKRFRGSKTIKGTLFENCFTSGPFKRFAAEAVKMTASFLLEFSDVFKLLVGRAFFVGRKKFNYVSRFPTLLRRLTILLDCSSIYRRVFFFFSLRRQRNPVI